MNSPGNDGESPIFIVCLNRYEDLVHLLLDNGAVLNVTTDGIHEIASEKDVQPLHTCFGKMVPKVNSKFIVKNIDLLKAHSKSFALFKHT